MESDLLKILWIGENEPSAQRIGELLREGVKTDFSIVPTVNAALSRLEHDSFDAALFELSTARMDWNNSLCWRFKRRAFQLSF